MNDFLLTLGKSPLARRLIQKSPLPLKLPPILKRTTAEWSETCLKGCTYLLAGGMGLQRLLESAGADVSVLPFAETGDRADVSAKRTFDGALFDGSHLEDVPGLNEVYQFFQSALPYLKDNARILVVGAQPQSCEEPTASACQEALSGFVKSLAKELGGKGITVNLVYRNEASELSGVLRFFLSDRAAFITGQVLTAGFCMDRSFGFTKILSDRRIVVTGAARGIGAAIAEVAAREGANLILVDHPKSLEQLASFAKKLGAKAVSLDLSEADAEKALVKKLWELGPIHGVIHNAGITRDKTLRRMTAQQWAEVERVNLQFPLALTQALLSPEQQDLLAKDAAFVFMSSVGGIAGNPGQTNYASSKAGLIGYVRAATARHFILQNNPAGPRVRFNAVAPGFISTQMTDAMPFAVREVARRFNSLKQAGFPGDVAEAAVYLISPAGAEISGQTIRVCGQNLVGA